jgi:hypothetical protein
MQNKTGFLQGPKNKFLQKIPAGNPGLKKKS